MAKTRKNIIHLNAGEWSPLMYSRYDQEKYDAASRINKNFIITAQGPIRKRNGMEFVAPAKYDDRAHTFFKFQFSKDDALAIEVGDQYFRFHTPTGQVRRSPIVVTGITAANPAVVTTAVTHNYDNGTEVYIYGLNEMTELNGQWYRVKNGTGTTFEITDRDDVDIDASSFTAETTGGFVEQVYEVESPYLEADVFELDYVQKDDVIWITHQDYAVNRLIRSSNTSWVLEEYDFYFPPALDDNVEDTYTLEVDKLDLASTNPATSVVMTATGFTPFSANSVGTTYELSHIAEGRTIKEQISATFTPSTADDYLRVTGAWTATTTDTWTATVEIKRSLSSDLPSVPYDSTEWETVNQLKSDNDRNFSITGDQEGEQRWFAITIPSYTSNSNARVYIEVTSQEVRGLVKVTAFNSTSSVDVDILQEVYSTDATPIWAEGAFSETSGYPRTCAFFENRLWFAGTNREPQKLWASEVGVFDRFRVGADDTDALNIELSSQERNEIIWLADQEKMLIGTSGGEWTLSGTELNSIIGPSNLVARRQETRGSKLVRPIMVDEVVVYVQRLGRKIREFAYDINRDRLHGKDLFLFSEHLSRGGINKITFSSDPYPTLWAVNGNGELLAMTYEKDQNVFGWSRMETEGTVTSCESIYGFGADIVFAGVTRTINGKTRMMIEKISKYFDTNNYSTQSEQDLDTVFLDSAITVNNGGTPSTTVQGLWHLEGESVDVWADGYVIKGKTVSNGSITLDNAADIVHAGLGYEARYQPMQLRSDLNMGAVDSYTMVNSRVYASVIDTNSLSYNDGNSDYEVSFRFANVDIDDPVPVYSGEVEMTLGGGHSRDPQIILFSDDPLPLTLSSLVVHYDVTGE